MIKAILNQFAENTYIIKEKDKAIIIDPGAHISEIKEFVDEHNLEVQYILLTHGHMDHIFSVNDVLEEYDCDVYIHELERDFLFDPNLNLSSMSYQKITVNDKKRVKTFKEGDILEFPYNNIEILHTPGHTRGSVCFSYGRFTFVGDTIFHTGVGRTDLPTGKQSDLEKSINKLLKKYRDNTVLYPGHGPKTTVLTQKNNCPYYKE